jgi:hypothetical protein
MSRLLEDSSSIFAVDRRGRSDNADLRGDGAEERELISERTRAALAAARAHGKVLVAIEGSALFGV